MDTVFSAKGLPLENFSVSGPLGDHFLIHVGGGGDNGYNAMGAGAELAITIGKRVVDLVAMPSFQTTFLGYYIENPRKLYKVG